MVIRGLSGNSRIELLQCIVSWLIKRSDAWQYNLFKPYFAIMMLMLLVWEHELCSKAEMVTPVVIKYIQGVSK